MRSQETTRKLLLRTAASWITATPGEAAAARPQSSEQRDEDRQPRVRQAADDEHRRELLVQAHLHLEPPEIRLDRRRRAVRRRDPSRGVIHLFPVRRRHGDRHDRIDRESVNERFGQERAAAAVRAANLGEDRAQELPGIRHVAVQLHRQPAADVARHDEHDELQMLAVVLVEQHDVRVVGENHRRLAHRAAVGRHEMDDAAIRRRRRHVVHVRDHRVTHAREVGVGEIGVGRAERRVLPVVAKVVLDAVQAVARARHHVARDVADFGRRVERARQRVRLEARRLLDERRDHLGEQRVLRLLRQLPIGDLGVVLQRPLGHDPLRAGGVPRLIGERGTHDEREDQQSDRADQAGRATHTSIHTF